MALIEVAGVPRPEVLDRYQVVESATPIDPDDSTPGYGQVTFSTQDWPTSRWMLSQEITLRDGIRGRVGGVVRAVDRAHQALVSMTADSELAKFNVKRIALPQTDQISAILLYYMDLCGIASTLDYQATDRRISVPSFTGNVWDHIKSFCSAWEIELAVVGETIVARDLAMHEAFLDRATDYTDSAETMTAARTVQVDYYNHHPIIDGEVYPVPEEDGDPAIIQVEAGETVVTEVEMSASLVSVNQPVHEYMPGPGDRSGTKGVYSVVGADNLPITVAQWAAGGGKVSAEIDPEDHSKLLIKVTGAKWEHLAPYRIAMSAGGTDYNSLHITGDGVARITRTALLHTGADPSVVMEEVGAHVQNPYITTMDQALRVGFHTAAAHAGDSYSISATVTDPHRHTPSQQIIEADLRDLDDYHEAQGQWTSVEVENAYGYYGAEGWETDAEDLEASVIDPPPGSVSSTTVPPEGMSRNMGEAAPKYARRLRFWASGTVTVNGVRTTSEEWKQYIAMVASTGEVTVTGSGRIGGLEFEQQADVALLSDFDDLWGHMGDLAAFSAFWEGRFLDQYENQMFGNVTGAIIKRPQEANYRITEVTTDSGVVSLQAAPYTTLEDFDGVWSGKTMDDLDELWFGNNLAEFSLTPLWYDFTGEEARRRKITEEHDRRDYVVAPTPPADTDLVWFDEDDVAHIYLDNSDRPNLLDQVTWYRSSGTGTLTDLGDGTWKSVTNRNDHIISGMFDISPYKAYEIRATLHKPERGEGVLSNQMHLGYYAYDPAFGTRLLTGALPSDDGLPTNNPYFWQGYDENPRSIKAYIFPIGIPRATADGPGENNTRNYIWSTPKAGGMRLRWLNSSNNYVEREMFASGLSVVETTMKDIRLGYDEPGWYAVTEGDE